MTKPTLPEILRDLNSMADLTDQLWAKPQFGLGGVDWKHEAMWLLSNVRRVRDNLAAFVEEHSLEAK